MISLGDDWMLQGSEIFHACGPGLKRRWDGGCVCRCGSAVPQRVESFHRWLRRERQGRSRASDRKVDPEAGRPLLRFSWW
jgi:hypothetical protein